MPEEILTFSASSMLIASVMRNELDAIVRSGARTTAAASVSARRIGRNQPGAGPASDTAEPLVEEERQVEPAVAPLLELHFADARPVVDADLGEAAAELLDRL